MFLNKDLQDYNIYFTEYIYEYNVMITYLSVDVDDTIVTIFVVSNIIRTFRELRFELIIDIEGDIFNINKDIDIRLGDIVIN